MKTKNYFHVVIQATNGVFEEYYSNLGNVLSFISLVTHSLTERGVLIVLNSVAGENKWQGLPVIQKTCL